MTRWLALALITLVGPLPPRQQVFRSRADGVIIQVSVRSGNRPVGGLRAEDFELRDNGVLQDISSLSAEQVPFDLTLMLDLSTSVDGPLLQRLKAAVGDTARLLHDDDRVRLVAISHVLHEVFSLRPRSEAMPLDGLVAEGATSLYDGLAAAMMHPTDPGRRQLVVAYTDGQDSSSIVEESAVKAIAKLTDAVVDIVVPISKPPEKPVNNPTDLDLGSSMGSSRVVTGSPSEMAARARALQPWATRDTVPPVLTDLVSPTAGQVFTPDVGDSISGVFKRVLDDFRAGYVLQYVPHGVTPAGWHDVTVSVTKPGKYDTRAKKGYAG
jgi:VWFA-related protein